MTLNFYNLLAYLVFFSLPVVATFKGKGNRCSGSDLIFNAWKDYVG